MLELLSKNDLTITKTPIRNKIKPPIKFVNVSDNMEVKKLPNETDRKDMEREIHNNIILLSIEIFVFFIPYVIPMPSESILLDIARTMQFMNMMDLLKSNVFLNNMRKFDKR